MEHFNQMFFHKKEDRKMRLFILLKNAPINGIHVNELAKEYSYSRKTMYADINELKLDLLYVYEKSILNEYPNGIFNLIFEKNHLTQKLILYYVKKSCDFWVFNSIAKNKKISFIALKDNLYYSQSSIYDSIRKLNNKLESLSISCSRAGLIGDEKKIRHLLFESYWSVFGGIEWPFSMKKEVLEAELGKLEQMGIRLTHLEKEKVLYWIAIIEMRLKIGKRLINQKNQPFENKKILFYSFFEKYCAIYYQDNNFEEEYRFLLCTFRLYLDIPLSLNEENIQKKVNKDVLQIGNQLILRGENFYLSFGEMVELKKRMAKINYYLGETISDWYHFLEPNAKIYFKENMSFIERNWERLLDRVPDEIKSIYLLEAEKNGITLVKPLRIKILSKEGKTLEIGRILKKYSSYPIEICSQNEPYFDVLATNFWVSSQINELDTGDVFYDWPLTERQAHAILEKAKQVHE